MSLYSVAQKVINRISINLSDIRTKILLHSFRKEQLSVGKDCSFRGTPILKIAKKSNIQFGNNCLINSSYQSNPAGVFMPCSLATIKANAIIKIGNNVGISGVSIVAATRIIIEDNVLIGAGSCIWDNDFHPINSSERFKSRSENYSTNEIFIGKNAFIGARSLILKGVKIGENAVIGAGSVVVADIPENTVYAGNPAKFIKSLENE